VENVIKITEIRLVNTSDEIVWREMWSDYNAFYGALVPDKTTTSTWNRIIDKESKIGALVAICDGKPIGFANYVLHDYSWSQGFACLMDDLFVIPKARGKGAAKLMIQTLIDMGHEHNWTRVYWMTREGNETARKLYDKFCSTDGFVRYTIALDGIKPTAGNSE